MRESFEQVGDQIERATTLGGSSGRNVDLQQADLEAREEAQQKRLEAERRLAEVERRAHEAENRARRARAEAERVRKASSTGVHHVRPGRLANLKGSELARAVILAEVLGKPLALREDDDGKGGDEAASTDAGASWVRRVV